ncbi:hypothetical protein ACGFYZ_35445 [Streptomyces sp. NPDC048330]|uniref:hypothetical protein n=1 Tax=Streptomyces sp. NPDC048330 TaxID=3365533 RepID=UPI003711B5BF
MTTTQACLDHLLTSTALDVRAIALCGSHRQGTADEVSDRDLWVFCADDQPISDHLATTAFLPPGARHEVLFEGRDDTHTDHTVVNVLTKAEVLNIKFLHTRVLTTFCGLPPTPEAQYMEDLENYLTMLPVHDPDGLLTAHQRWLQLHAQDTIPQWLTPQVLNHYGATYWRSVYQGVLRTETHVWRHQINHLTELLAWAAFATDGQVPPPRKWLFSPRLLTRAPHGETILTVLETAAATSRPLDAYQALARAEDAILPAAGETTMWWRNVFTQRLTHLARHLNRPHLATLAAHAPTPRSAP